ncbi:nucleoside phosphatase family-domain-containing protein, partial [Paraphysoderma sedebokerense]
MSQSDSSPLFGPVPQRRSTNSFAIDLSNMPSAPSIRLHKRTLSNSDRHEPPASQPLQMFLWFTKSKRRLLFFAGFIFMLYLTFSPRSISTGKYIPVRFSTQCSKPSDPSLPHLQYALMIDAGSTGSRIHVYRFNYCNSASPSLEHEIFEQVKPGLSSYANNAMQAAESLKPLLEIAKDAVPDDMEHCTPLQVKATAGLRKLPGDQSQEILRAVKMLLRNQYPFPVVGGEVGVDVMDGANEGIALFILNYPTWLGL